MQVLNINKDKQEISLGMKQVQPNPWDKVAERYPPNTQIVNGMVRNLTNYGAFIEIEEGIDGLLHVSDMSWVRKVGHPSARSLSKGDKVTCIILNVDQERKRIALGLKQMANDPWEGDIPGRYHPGEVKKGKVTKLTNFGVFVELEPGLEGLLHISELADQQGREPRRRRQGRRRDRGQGAARRCRRPQDRPEPQASERARRTRGSGGHPGRPAQRAAGDRTAGRRAAQNCAAAPAAAAASSSRCRKPALRRQPLECSASGSEFPACLKYCRLECYAQGCKTNPGHLRSVSQETAVVPPDGTRRILGAMAQAMHECLTNLVG